jgi:hypothetical protein
MFILRSRGILQEEESEIALHRKETSRKRKNLSEKKLEDEKMSIAALQTMAQLRNGCLHPLSDVSLGVQGVLGNRWRENNGTDVFSADERLSPIFRGFLWVFGDGR